ncbi:rhodanese-related sulfurtransferase [Litoreibacter ponti]|uniref:Rhodanese-related sulfurtransferase n=1 Tax=Litoreibacter ponti TaxID=1510457 RepID=A0A2T6BNG8_9RHOB|nr:rhodanese-like domain-containing protein [Litoreibacter ponti]PTX57592.1 rhodanese-related sulfurtransferase [Litoreibacter ponti]
MSTDTGPAVQELLPAHTWDRLEKDPNAVLIDVRTKAEWSFVGKPDLSSLNRSVITIEWCEYPDMSVNPRFVEEVKEALDGSHPSAIFFICRSGARSMNAARAVSASSGDLPGTPDLFNVAEGFEGDLDSQERRGGLNGWKAQGLPWRQS